MQGRSDKVFCSKKCKNDYHSRRRNQHQAYSQPIDRILHRNWVILAEFQESIGKRKFHVPLSDLLDAGFQPRYFTTMEVNSKGKTYHYIYNFGWMNFTEKEVLVVVGDKPK